ncbi:MAG TPA: S41 family peptidase [Telluria sp.]|nr:S41 family peptidase [Telluria sp.]
MNAVLSRLLASCLLAVSAVAGAQARPDMAVDAATRTQVIDALVSQMHARYVFPDTARAVETRLRAEQQAGKYDQVTSARQFAKALTESLRASTNDKHLHVMFSAQALPATKADDEAELARESSRNNGVMQVERQRGNIGYLKIDSFPFPRFVEEAYGAAMTLLAGTEALIIDLRSNVGGEPEGVALLESYFFGQPTLMNTVHYRNHARPTEYWTAREVRGRRYGESKPVYILTGARTVSGGEDLSYSMQARKRATLVGAVTAGGANPGEVQRLTEHFQAFIPDGHAVNPVTGASWERIGVTPDVLTAQDDALRQARILALTALRAKAGSDDERASLEAILQKESAALQK